MISQAEIRIYPKEIRLEVGKTRTVTAVALDTTGNYIPNRRFNWTEASRSQAAAIRQSIEGNTESNNSRYSRNLGEITGLRQGSAFFVAELNGVFSERVEVTVVDPAADPVAVIKGDNETSSDGAIHVRTGEAVEVNADDSLGTASVEWLWGDGDRTSGLLSATHAFLYAGNYSVTLRVTNSLGIIDESSVTVIVTDHPPPVRTFLVTSMSQLRAAYDQCTGGEHIIIPAGTVLSGSVELPHREFSDFVTIRSSAAMPGLAVRVAKDHRGLAVLRGSHPNEIPMVIRNRASKIRISGLKFEPFPGGNDTLQNYYLLQVGEAFGQASIDDNPQRIIIEHCVVNPPNGSQVVHAILNDGYKVSIISSWLGNIKTYGSQDSQAVFSLDGRGAHVYNNTFFEAASESIIYGGATNQIDGIVPTNIEFRRCVFTKSVAWRSLPPNSDGDTLNVKSLFETKNARRLYVEASEFSNHWDASRSQYYSIVVKSTADTPGGEQGSPWSVSEEIVFQNNRVSHINGALAIAREFTSPGVVYDTLKPQDIRFINVLFDDLTFGRWGSDRGWAIFVAGADDLQIRNTTLIDAIDKVDEEYELLLALNSVNSYRPVIKDSILPLNYYGIRNTCGEGIAAMNVGTSGWFDTTTGSSCAATSDQSPGEWTIEGNIFPKMRSIHYPNSYPSGNAYPENYSGVGMERYRNCHISIAFDPCKTYVTDFALRADSHFRGTASDGSDPGINSALLAERLRCTASGDTRSCIEGSGVEPPPPTPIPTPGGGLEGDITPRTTGDGGLLTNDLLLLREFVAGLVTPAPGTNEFQRIDVAPYESRGDGRLNAADIAVARQYISGILPSQPAGGPMVPTTQSGAQFWDGFNEIEPGTLIFERDWPALLAEWFEYAFQTRNVVENIMIRSPDQLRLNKTGADPAPVGFAPPS
ncbi:MAG: PKD domain-containing protein [Pyrinomonadaceae bacterium]